MVLIPTIIFLIRTNGLDFIRERERERERGGGEEYTPGLKYSVPLFVE